MQRKEPPKPISERKNLVVYFSVYGTAKKTAEEIAKQTNADIREIISAEPYDSDRSHYNSLARRAKEEHDKDMRPAIKNNIDIKDYDNFFIGYPMWWCTFPMIIYTFFEKHDFINTTIIPFNTHMGSGGRRHIRNNKKSLCLPQTY